MGKTWIVLANASRARVRERDEPGTKAHQRFAREIAQHLDRGVASRASASASC